MKITPMFAWYDIWVGCFIDSKKKTVYLFPVPMLGFKIEYSMLHRHETPVLSPLLIILIILLFASGLPPSCEQMKKDQQNYEKLYGED